MMPLWLFTLGRRIFEQANLVMPYSKIATFAIGLVVPLILGYFIQRKMPRFSRLMVRIMKPFSIVLVVFIIIFAIVTNVYLFKLFSWQVRFLVWFIEKKFMRRNNIFHYIALSVSDHRSWIGIAVVGFHNRFVSCACFSSTDCGCSSHCHRNRRSKHRNRHISTEVQLETASCWSYDRLKNWSIIIYIIRQTWTSSFWFFNDNYI